MLCVSGRHEWSNPADAAKCCNGFARVFALNSYGQVTFFRREWIPCSHEGSLMATGSNTALRCTSCGLPHVATILQRKKS